MSFLLFLLNSGNIVLVLVILLRCFWKNGCFLTFGHNFQFRPRCFLPVGSLKGSLPCSQPSQCQPLAFNFAANPLFLSGFGGDTTANLGHISVKCNSVCIDKSPFERKTVLKLSTLPGGFFL